LYRQELATSLNRVSNSVQAPAGEQVVGVAAPVIHQAALAPLLAVEEAMAVGALVVQVDRLHPGDRSRVQQAVVKEAAVVEMEMILMLEGVRRRLTA
jgi:hypothetical protein